MKWVLAVFAIIGWCAVVAVIGAYIEIRLSEKKAAMTERSAVEKFRDFLEARGAGRLLEGETEEPPSVAVVRPTRDQIALRETVERAMTVADGCVAVTEERPSETWRAAFTASVFASEAESEKEREFGVAVSDSQETPTKGREK